MTSGSDTRRQLVRRTRSLASCAPGLGRMLRRKLDDVDGIVTTGTGFDGRADLVFFDADQAGRAAAVQSRMAAWILAETGRTNRAGGAGAAAVAAMAWQRDAVQRALSVWAEQVRPLGRSMSFRVIVSVLSEARFRRSDLRKAMTAVVARDKPRWQQADPAQLEIWICEWHDGQYVAGLQLSDGAAGTGLGLAERSQELARTVAAAMVDLAGPPVGLLLDPCCDGGAILIEAVAVGWAAEGTDIDTAAVAAARRNAPGARVQLGDAREILLPDDSVRACVSRLPRVAQSDVSGQLEGWAKGVLAELSRVTHSGGFVVLLGPQLPRPAIPAALRLRKTVPIRLPGSPAIWVFRRA